MLQRIKPFALIFLTGAAIISSIYCGDKDKNTEESELDNFFAPTEDSISDFEKSHYQYPGMEEHAVWRQRARTRIEEQKKHQLRVFVLNEKGKPIPNANISIKMLSHGSTFGSAITVDAWKNSQIYMDKL